MNSFKSYQTYFKNIATANLSLLHTDSKPAFVSIIRDDSGPFASMYLKDLLQKIARNIAGTFLVCELPLVDHKHNGADNRSKTMLGSFLILRKTKVDDPQDVIDKIDECEAIADQVMAYMLKDFSERSELRSLRFTATESEAISPITSGHYAGVRYNFSYQVNNNSRLKYDPSKWQ